MPEHDAALVSLVPGQLPHPMEEVVFARVDMEPEGGLVLTQGTPADDREPLVSLLHRFAGVLGFAVVPLVSGDEGEA